MIIENKKCIFLDFDGVIKDSVAAKADAFESLFSSFGEEISLKVRRHHEINGGISRLEKLPLYLSWAGLSSGQNIVNKYSEKFSFLALRKVIDSAWVPGILDLLHSAEERVHLFIVTATPQAEIEEILSQLEIAHYFSGVSGAPTPKGNAIESLLEKFSIPANQAVMIGDAINDYKAAQSNNVDFVLRRTQLNRNLQLTLNCSMVTDFTDVLLKG